MFSSLTTDYKWLTLIQTSNIIHINGRKKDVYGQQVDLLSRIISNGAANHVSCVCELYFCAKCCSVARGKMRNLQKFYFYIL